MTIQVTDAMVSRFLAWPLPKDFAPDCHVYFDREAADAFVESWPTGTNLLSATQARAMLEHVLGVEASGAISSKTAKVDVIFGGEVLARGVSPADPGQGPIDLGEVTGTKPASCAYGKCVQDVGQCAGGCLAAAPDLRPTAPVEADTLGEAKAEQQTAHQLSDSIEAEIVAKGLTAPRITPADVEAVIASEHYFTAEDGMMGSVKCDPLDPARTALSQVTFCVLLLRNGHKIVGVNTGSVSASNFDADLARKLARKNAVDQIWPLLGYSLRERLASGGGL